MKLLPGYDNIDLENARLQKERQAAYETAQRQYEIQLDRARDDVRNSRKNAPTWLINWNAAKSGLKVFIIANLAALGLNTAVWADAQSDKDPANPRYLDQVTYLESLKNAFTGSEINKFGRSAANHTMMNMLLVLLAYLFASRHAHQKRHKQHVYALNIYSALKYYNGKELDAILRTDLGKMALRIIHNMSANDATYFNYLVKDGKFTDASYKFVMTIIRGHLKSHPKDIDAVLDNFNPDCIPTDLLRQYSGYSKHTAKQKIK